MDQPLISSRPGWARRSMATGTSRRGAALLLVLVALAVLTVLVLSLFVNINSELHTSKLYASSSSVKLLSQSAVSLVMAEIYQATSDNTLCWASQPGMIRTYTAKGAPNQYFKLYSDTAMIGSGAFDHTQAGLVPDGTGGTTPWYNQKGVYVDLNQPLSVNGTNQYPILDGDSGASDLIPYTYPGTLPTLMTPTPSSGGAVSVYGPTWSNNGITTPQVAGFWLNGNAPVSPTSPNQAPMPVKWLYVLRDGEVAVPDTGTGSTAVTFTGSTVKPSAADPITGRIAFWTDDETSKVNINTASEGSYNKVTTGSIASSFTDTPRVCTPFDLNLAETLPFQNEFQRYPGHPSTVSLSTVFGNLATAAAFPENIYSTATAPGIAPRTMAGGSKEGTVQSAAGGTALALAGNRLYATPEEILLSPNHQSLSSSLIDQPAMKRAQFFITSSSRAPDVNLFNLPRICLWPISGKGSAYLTPFDQLIAFCTTIAGQPYYFQRQDWTSPLEWSAPSRNSTVTSYLKYFCNQLIPGFGGSTFAAKYSAQNGKGGIELDQILMEIFDYIRSTNIYDSSLAAGHQFNPTTVGGYGFGEVVPSYNAGNDTKGFGRYPIISKAGVLFIASADATHKQVIPPSTNTTLVYGPAVPAGKVRVQAALVFQLFDPAQGYTALVPDCNIKVINSSLNWNTGQAGQTTSPTSPMFLLANGAVYPTGGTATQTPAWGGNLGTLPMINAYFNGELVSWVPTLATQTSTAANPFPDFNLAGPIIFSGTVEAQVVTTGGAVVQDVTFTFPQDSISGTPSYVPATTAGNVEQMSIFGNIGTLNGRMSANGNSAGTSSNLWRFFVGSTDIMQSVQCTSGDLRLVAGHATIPPSYAYNPSLFGPHPKWGSQFAHSFEDGDGQPYYGATRGQLVSGVTSYWSSATGTTAIPLASPFTTSSVSGSNDAYYLSQNNGATTSFIQTCEPEGFGTTTTAPATGVTAGSFASLTVGNPPGDFDNGTGAVRDGPYINKADEGGLVANAVDLPYFMDSGEAYTATGTTYFSPAREMPSAVMLGSLSTGVIGDKPWQTLLFHPDYTSKHAGAQVPMDHLMLDLFTMPVVEPYAISEPLSTAGRVNVNYLIVPFTYIHRDTAVRAVLESQQILAIPNTDSGSSSASTLTYKQMFNYNSHNPKPTFTGANSPFNLRFGVNLDETLKGFQQRFFPAAFNSASVPDIFRSPSEICTLDLVPNDTTDANAKFGSMQAYWQNHALTGDNSRERPYANIYPLLTTKSNTFTVHFRVQTLQPTQGPGASATTWREGTDVVTSEYRGSQTIERYVDPSATLPDYAASNAPSTLAPLSSFYRFRVVSTQQFSP